MVILTPVFANRAVFTAGHDIVDVGPVPRGSHVPPSYSHTVELQVGQAYSQGQVQVGQAGSQLQVKSGVVSATGYTRCKARYL